MSETKDDLPKHLEMIQGVIERHARTSFLLKGWSITLVVAIFLLVVRGAEPALAMTAGLLPAVMFWMLDGYYLLHERRYRDLFNKVRIAPVDENDRFTLDARSFRQSFRSRLSPLFSASVFFFHLTIIVVVAGALCYFERVKPDGP